MKNQVIENIMTRASVRKYTDEPVEAEKIETILRAGMAAPSAVNKQPWHFVVVTDRAKLDAIEQYRSPLAIVVCGNADEFIPQGREWWIADASLASENILLAAHALGLGGIWTVLFPLQDYMDGASTALGLPDNLIPLNVIILGYPAESPRPKDKWNPAKITYIAEQTDRQGEGARVIRREPLRIDSGKISVCQQRCSRLRTYPWSFPLRIARNSRHLP